MLYSSVLKSYMRINIICIVLIFRIVHPCLADEFFIEAESFDCKGGWKVDQQFMDIMGSLYLLAHGLGNRVEDAKTKISVNEDGVYSLYVRTYDWVSPWFDGKGPGLFRISIDGKRMINELGCYGKRWEWQYVGRKKWRKVPMYLLLMI